MDNRRLVLVAEDHHMVRDAVRVLLEGTREFIVLTAGDGEEAVALVDAHGFDLALIDVRMPGIGGVEATRRILRKHPRLPVLAISGSSEAAAVAEMIRAGARGFITKSSNSARLIEAVRAVVDGGSYMDSGISDLVIHAVRSPDRIELAPQQLRVLEMTSRGLSIKEIANAMQISIWTVKTHRRVLMKKTRSENAAGLTNYYFYNCRD